MDCLEELCGPPGSPLWVRSQWEQLAARECSDEARARAVCDLALILQNYDALWHGSPRYTVAEYAVLLTMLIERHRHQNGATREE